MQQHICPQQGNNWTMATLSHHKKEIQKALNQFTVFPYPCILTQTPKQHKALKQGLWDRAVKLLQAGERDLKTFFKIKASEVQEDVT